MASLGSGLLQAAPPTEPLPTLPLEDIRPGMRGYGLTVFNGTRIEPFPVEVISVMRDFAPSRGVIWIRCLDERLQQSGPVQGMSGSPIFLWRDGEEAKLGTGGRLIGAFAFGFAMTKDCYAGVQPIELMRQTAGRVDLQDKPKAADAGPRGPGRDPTTLASLVALARQQGYSDRQMTQTLALLRLSSRGAMDTTARSIDQPLPAVALGDMTARPMQLGLPVSLPAELASYAPLLTPMFAGSGLTPMAAPAAMAGNPPPGLDVQNVELSPGSVLAIPLAWGAMDLSASGTVTEVLPDGRVLGFGHAMFGEGASRVPMANGYVHLVMPSSQISFKLGGSGVIRGAILRDENSAVVGLPGATFTSAPLTVGVTMPGVPRKEYRYQVVHHDALTPIVAAISTIRSITADQNQPRLSSMNLKIAMRFQGGREISFTTIQRDNSPMPLLMAIVPPVATMAQNPFESVLLESMSVEADVTPTIQAGTLVQGWLDRVELEPGEELGVTVRIQPYAKPAYEQRLKLTLPHKIEPGDYQIMVGDSNSYQMMLLGSRPHLMSATNVDQLFNVMKRLTTVRNDALYVVMQMPGEGLAVGQQELGQLPSSRRALIESPTSTLVTTFRDMIESMTPVPLAIEGQMMFTIRVREPAAHRAAGDDGDAMPLPPPRNAGGGMGPAGPGPMPVDPEG